MANEREEIRRMTYRLQTPQYNGRAGSANNRSRPTDVGPRRNHYSDCGARNREVSIFLCHRGIFFSLAPFQTIPFPYCYSSIEIQSSLWQLDSLSHISPNSVVSHLSHLSSGVRSTLKSCISDLVSRISCQSHRWIICSSWFNGARPPKLTSSVEFTRKRCRNQSVHSFLRL